MNNIDILYYDYMAEMVSENRKIKEQLFGFELTEKFNESSFINESKFTDSLIEFFKNIFDKMIEFFNKLINFIKGDKFKPNEKLIKACEEKLKNSKFEFKLEKVDPTSIAAEYSKKADNIFKDCDQYLQAVMDKLEPVLTNGIGIINGLIIANKEDIEKVNEELDKYTLSNIDKNQFKDVSTSDIKDILNYYNRSSELNEINGKFKEAIKRVQRYKSKIKQLYSYRVNGVELAKDVQHMVSATSSIIIKAAKVNIDLNVMTYRAWESILRKFVSTKSQSESANYFDTVLESFIYDEYVAE